MKGKIKLTGIWHFLIFFLLIAFVVTCNFYLFLHSMELDAQTISHPAKMTLANVLLLTLLFCIVDAFRRSQMIAKPVKRIQGGIERVIKGDFTTRIEYIHGEDSGNEFDTIITGLNQMIEELSGVETLRTDFIANVSHELKTPLAVMQNYGTLLQNPELSDEQRIEYGKAIQEQTNRLSSLVTNILKLNKLENQQIYPNVEKYYLGEQLCECMLTFEALWEEKKIEIETDIDDEVLIEADKELLDLVWHNLLSNALKFTEENGKVTLSLYKDDQYVYVQVKDTGCGMSAETGKNIFKKFYQGDTSHATKGNGLGLALVKRVIDICGGEIAVSSQLGEGSTFTVKLRQSKG
ncbi:MAG: HAMP domain-containing sensor histidine kinase [Clostridiales bacterium]|nr:HAMP domain-containing histidine kinase [Roseburia sp.]MDD7637724.1 HAMP domain-containing sensor histidine kinase [Clostridiales bacterium]MDY4111381.1 HAMP domain-containing sensor histidine kinase [Roseburia sp.]